eukprot:6203435-Amphidinium_carterae.2
MGCTVDACLLKNGARPCAKNLVLCVMTFSSYTKTCANAYGIVNAFAPMIVFVKLNTALRIDMPWVMKTAPNNFPLEAIALSPV